MEVEKDRTKLLEEFNKIFSLSRNKLAKIDFLELVKNLKVEKCEVKIGWVSGECISFACKFTKGTQSNLWNEIVKGIPEEKISKYLYFIYGLNPQVFQFNPKFIFENAENLHLTFTLKKDTVNE